MTQIGREVAHLLGGKQPQKVAPPISEPDPSVLTALPDDAPPLQAPSEVEDDNSAPSGRLTASFITVTAILVIGSGITIIVVLALLAMLLW